MENKLKAYNTRRYKKAKQINVESLIKSRLSMQSTAREFENKFNIPASMVLSDSTLSKYKTWNNDKQENFISLIGGIYKYETKQYIENLINKK